MKRFLHNTKIKLRDWAVRHADGPHAKFWLGFVAFTEATIFPIPPDILLAAILMAKERMRWVFYTIFTTVFSVFGGAFGYLIGFLLFSVVGDSIVSFYGLEDKIVFISGLFIQNAFLAIFLAGFTPLPYKAFAIASGIFHINFLVFLVASILGRGLRFTIVAYMVQKYRDKFAEVLYKYFNWITLFMALVIFTFLYFTL